MVHILALTPFHNEEKMIPGFLKNVFLLADYMIALDDGSSDRTWELLKHKKIKRIRRERLVWNDLANRNILLHEAYKLKPEWILWLDADERFEPSTLLSFKKRVQKIQSNIISFNLYHCWNSIDTYRADYPTSSEGMQIKRRMFRYTNHAYLKSTLHYHFTLIPISGRVWHSNQVVKHLGNITILRRIKRFIRYTFYDRSHNNGIGYWHFLSWRVHVKKFTNK